MPDAPLMVSVSGLRGLVGQSLTPEVAARFAASFGQWLGQKRGDGKAPLVVFGRDSRPSGPMVQAAATAGLMAVGCRVIDLGIVATPTVAIMAEQLHADGGMVATASHNPIVWNGLKALRADGVAPPPEDAKQIIETFNANRITYAPVERLHPPGRDDSSNAVHVERVLPHMDVTAIRRAKLRVVLDSVCGAGGAAAAALLGELGVELIHMHSEPTGQFPHPPEPTRENLTSLGEAVRRHQAHIGFAQDPDADRLAIVDERGTYIGEEYTLVLAALRVLERGRVGSGAARAPAGVLAANLSTSRMIDDVAAGFGARVIRTPVGEANVAAAMRAKRALIGGEGNGGVIWPDVVFVRDSIGGMALVLELLATRHAPLSRILDTIPRYSIIKDKTDLRPDVTPRIGPLMRQRYQGLAIDDRDGIRVDWPDKWVHARASNTEPILRFIAEARDESAARDLISQVRELLGI